MSIFRFDSISYLEISRSAPALPKEINISLGYPEFEGKNTIVQMPYHHAQRLVGPFLIGLVSKQLSIKPEYLFAVLAPLLILLTALLLVDAAATLYPLSDKQQSFLFAIYILNPYVSRFYIAIPTYLGDLLFLFGFAFAIWALIKEKAAFLLVALFIASCGRQTGILLLPAIGLWIFLLSKWSRDLIQAGLIFSACVLIVVLTYFFTGKAAELMSGPSINAEIMKGIFVWVKIYFFGNEILPQYGVPLLPDSIGAERSAWKDFASFLVRGMMGIIIPIAVFLALAWKRLPQGFSDKRALLFIFMILSVSSQPILAGPAISGATIIRLMGVTMPAWILLLGWALGKNRALATPLGFAGIISALSVASMHHRYTFLALGLDYAPLFAGICALIAALLFVAFLRASRN
jgi:hypothetical protein